MHTLDTDKQCGEGQGEGSWGLGGGRQSGEEGLSAIVSSIKEKVNMYYFYPG